ncbi:hypothetical protein SL617_30430, partial [Klebsiella michiganensis]|uniref:hypothetical protein n=1 Tax=Klebsiella michiganensis TaxID=1134687 RepID=UPI0038624DAF
YQSDGLLIVDPEGHSDDVVNSLTVSLHESMGRVIGIGGGHTHVDKELGQPRSAGRLSQVCPHMVRVGEATSIDRVSVTSFKNRHE